MTNFSAPNFEQIAPTVKVLALTDGRKWLKYQGPKEIVRLFYRVAGARVYDGGQTLVLPLNRENVMALEILAQLEEPDAEYAAAARELLWPSERGLALYPPTVPGAPEPKWHQTANFGSCLDALIAGGKGHLNAAIMGAGKSRATIDIMRHLVNSWALIIGRKTTLEQWVEELARAWPEAEAHVLHQIGKGTIPERAGHLYRLRSSYAPPAPPQ